METKLKVVGNCCLLGSLVEPPLWTGMTFARLMLILVRQEIHPLAYNPMELFTRSRSRKQGWQYGAVRYGTQVQCGTLHFSANSTVRLYGT